MSVVIFIVYILHVILIFFVYHVFQMEHVHYLHKLVFELDGNTDVLRVLCILKYFPCYPGAGFGIGEGVVVVLHAEAASSCNGLELMIRQVSELATGGAKGVVELIVGIVHPIDAEDGLEAAFVEGLVVCHKGQALDERLYLCPHVGEDGGVVCVGIAEAMHLLTPIVVVVRFGLNE